jgi:hypothetical protein
MGWGRIGVEGRESFGEDLVKLTRGANLTRGLGRSYGDSSLPAAASDRVANATLANRVLALWVGHARGGASVRTTGARGGARRAGCRRGSRRRF